MTDWRSPDHDPEGCPGCRPVAFDPQTGRIDVRVTAIADKAFDATTPDERRAWHRVTCLNSRDLIDVNLAKAVAQRIQSAFDKAGAN